MPRGSWLFSQILFDVIIQDWRNLIVEFLHFLRNYIYCLHDGAEFSKTYPSFLTVKEGSTSHLGLLSSGEKKETALLGARNRYALRLADHQRSRHIVRDGTALMQCFLYLILRLILYESEESKDKLNMLLSSH